MLADAAVDLAASLGVPSIELRGVPLPEGVHPEAEVFLGKVKTARYATPSTHDLPNSLSRSSGPTPTRC